MVVINGFELFSENHGDELLDSMVTITRDCQKYGIYFVLTSSSVNGIRSKLAQYLPNHLVLQMNDKYDYSSLLSRTKLEPASVLGRGLVKLDDVYEFQAAIPCDREQLNTFVMEKAKGLCETYKITAPKIPVLPETVTVSYCAEENKGINGVPVGVEKETLRIRTLDISKNIQHTITGMEFETVRNFGEMFIRQLSKFMSKNIYLFDAEKAYKDLNSIVNYFDTNFVTTFKSISDKITEMYSKFEQNGFDSSVLNDYENIVCVVVGVDKFKTLLGAEYGTCFNDVFTKIKSMPKVHLIIIDSVDNIKKMEFETWYKTIVNPSRGIWIGEGISNQFVLKSTQSARVLSAKIDDKFGYFIDGSVTVLMKVFTEIGEVDDDYEAL